MLLLIVVVIAVEPFTFGPEILIPLALQENNNIQGGERGREGVKDELVLLFKVRKEKFVDMVLKLK